MKKRIIKTEMETENHSNGTKRKSRTGKRSLWKIGVLLLAVILSVTGCKKDKETPPEVSIEEKVEQAFETIKLTADSILLSDDPIVGFEAIVEEYRKIDGVDSIENGANGIFVKFISGEMVGWFIPPEFTPSIIDEMSVQNIKSSIKQSHSTRAFTPKSVCLLDQQDGEARDQKLRDSCLSALEHAFSVNNWSVTKKIGQQVTLDFVANHLADYDAIYYIAHGIDAHGKTWILTNGRINNTIGQGNNLIRVFPRTNLINGTIVMESKYAFCGDFIRHYYTPGSFTGDIIYMVACQSMGSAGSTNLSMARAFTDHGGASVYIGWDETNWSGEEAGKNIYEVLLQGKTLGETWQWLSQNRPDLMLNTRTVLNHSRMRRGLPLLPAGAHFDADLMYYPPSADTVRLVNPNITMIADTAVNISFSLKTLGSVTLYWGDGNFQKFPQAGDDILCEHTYTAPFIDQTIRIEGRVEILKCINNKLSVLDVSNSPALKQLWCSTNKLSVLDVSKNPLLIYLACINNKLTALDVNKNTILKELYCGKNAITSLNVSNNTILTILECRNNKLEKEALNSLFNSLHDNWSGEQKRVIINDNPGAGDCDRRIALDKGWSFAL